MPKAPKIIEELIKNFERDIDNLKSAAYNETQLRTDFVNPFWKALGWDMTNEAGYAIPYRDVKQEFPLKVGLTTKAPDYCFTIAGKPKFFLETKKPSVDVKHKIDPAYQLRRYGWSGKLPLSILTDFEEMAIYDCRIRPKKNDKSSIARINYYTCQEYIDKWDEIESVFSRDAILKGSFDKYVESKKGKRGTSEVDTEFLKEIEKWREELARNIALRNPAIDIRQINFAVQRTIDRIIFLRMCEDRGIEDYSQLQNLCESTNIYKRLVDVFKNADDKYNSGLFHFRKETGRASTQDTLTPNIRIDDKIIKEILTSLYYPESPYEFSFMPAEILGNVYEQFLGKVIRLTKGHQAKVEEKPEVRKAGGVYYTPAYIVDYIVENTVGKLCDGKKPKDISKLKILDPACGSGSFLLGAYQFLLDYHLKYYTDEMDKTGKIPKILVSKPPVAKTLVSKPPSKAGKGKKTQDRQAIYQGQDGGWYLTTTEKKRILLNNIYGVDIDSQAVEVTKLSLLLKVLENENKDTLNQQILLIKERALPDLSDNIKCGNSLIASDFYTQSEQTLMFDDEEQYRINAFDWDVEFPDIMKGRDGGFDAVIGNPPYVRQETISESKEYFQSKYQSYHGVADLYTYFIEKGISLLHSDGLFGFIVANKWMRANYGEPLRNWLKTKCVKEIIDFGDLPVFKKATTYPCILIVKNANDGKKINATNIETLDFGNLADYVIQNRFVIATKDLSDEGWKLARKDRINLLGKLKATGIPLKEYVEDKIYRGVLTGLNKAFVIDEAMKDKLIAEDAKSAELIKPFLTGRNIKRYCFPVARQFLIFIPNGWTRVNSNARKNHWEWIKSNYPAIAKHLEQFRDAAQKRCDQGEFWWELRSCVYYSEFEKTKILLPDISLRGNFTLDGEESQYCANTAYIIGSNDKYMLGVLNSKLMTFFYSSISSSYKGGYLRFIYQYLIKLPIRTIDFTDPADKARHDKMVKLVDNMLTLHKRIQDSNTPHDSDMIQRQIVATDRQIDNLVYELYGLSDEEVAVVEGSF